MVNSSTGYLYQIKRFDYENTTIQCSLGKGGGFLNVTAEVIKHVCNMIVFTSENLPRKQDNLWIYLLTLIQLECIYDYISYL